LGRGTYFKAPQALRSRQEAVEVVHKPTAEQYSESEETRRRGKNNHNAAHEADHLPTKYSECGAQAAVDRVHIAGQTIHQTPYRCDVVEPESCVRNLLNRLFEDRFRGVVSNPKHDHVCDPEQHCSTSHEEEEAP
jgi:hypothetical protein